MLQALHYEKSIAETSENISFARKELLTHKQWKRMKAKNILTLDHAEAMNFFMKSEQYHGFELPEYFTFDELLNFVRETIGDTKWTRENQ